MVVSAERPATISDISPLALFLPPLAVIAFLGLTSPHETESTALVAAFALLLLPWGSFLCWRTGAREGLPVFAMIGATYWVFFGLALLWAPRELFLEGAFGTFVPSQEVVTASLFLALVGVIAMRLGMHVPVSVWLPARLPDIVDVPRSWVYVRIVLAVGVGLNAFPSTVWLLGAGGRQAITTLSTVVPNVAFVLLLLRHMSGRATRADRATLFVAAGFLVVSGLSSGWLGSVTSVCVLYGSTYLVRQRRIPWMTVCLAAVTVLFLQVGKNEFRTIYWSERAEGGVEARIGFWLSESASRWRASFEDNAGYTSEGLATETLQRVSLLPQVAHVLDMTPSQVPFQGGATYKYLAVTLVPRFLWPDKPSISDANRFYQVEYGLTSERGLDSVSIAVGSLGEAYINFGWPGVLAIMFAIGIVLGVYERTLGLTKSSSLFLAIGIALIPGFLTIESQLGQYFGGVLQQALLATAVFLPVTKRRSLAVQSGESQASRNASIAWQNECVSRLITR
jgi:hypothetical protein